MLHRVKAFSQEPLHVTNGSEHCIEHPALDRCVVNATAVGGLKPLRVGTEQT